MSEPDDDDEAILVGGRVGQMDWVRLAGSLKFPCSRCPQLTWLDPFSQAFLMSGKHPVIKVICFDCYQAAERAGEIPEGTQTSWAGRPDKNLPWARDALKDL
jgi:hypothetical protein